MRQVTLLMTLMPAPVLKLMVAMGQGAKSAVVVVVVNPVRQTAAAMAQAMMQSRPKAMSSVQKMLLQNPSLRLIAPRLRVSFLMRPLKSLHRVAAPAPASPKLRWTPMPWWLLMSQRKLRCPPLRQRLRPRTKPRMRQPSLWQKSPSASPPPAHANPKWLQRLWRKIRS